MNEDKIYDAIIELSKNVATLTANQENLEKVIASRPCQSHETALGKLEASKLIAVTVLSTLSFVGGVLGGCLVGLFDLIGKVFKA